VVHIQSPKCTIGSAEGCTLRLRSAGIEAASCWILRGAAGTIIRRLDGAALLNGQPFDEALLEPGDRLQIGSVELELVKLRSDSLTRAALGPPASLGAEESPPRLRETEGRLAAAETLAASRASELEATRRELDALRQQLGQKQAADTALRTAADMARRELAAQSAAVLRREQDLSEARAAAASEREAWTTEREAWTTERRTLETQLEQITGELRSARAAAIADSTMTVPLARCSTADAELQARCVELENQLAQLQTENQDLHTKAECRVELEHSCSQLSLELEGKCREVGELQDREAAAASRARSQSELEAKPPEKEAMRQNLAPKHGADTAHRSAQEIDLRELPEQ
jgi:chromosome segregation ATPase